MAELDRPVSRRTVLAGLGTALAASTFPAPAIHAQGVPVLRYLNDGVSAYPEILAKAEKDLGIKIELTRMSIRQILGEMVTQPNFYDIIDTEATGVNQLRRLGRLQYMDAQRITHYPDMAPLVIEGKINGTQVSRQGDAPFKTMFVRGPDDKELANGPTRWMSFIPTVYNADTLGIRPDLIDRPVTKWRDLFHPDFSGRAATLNIPSIGILDAAMAIESAGSYVYTDKGDMTRDEIDMTVGFLVKAKQDGHFAGIWGEFEESVELMTSGKAVIQSMWSPAVTIVRQQGVPCTYQPLEEGYRGWTHGFALPSTVTGRTRDIAYEFINWSLSGWRGAYLQRQGYYSSVLKTCQAHMTENEWGYWMEGKAATAPVPGPGGDQVATVGDQLDGGSYENRLSRIACWNSYMTEARHLVRQWRKFA